MYRGNISVSVRIIDIGYADTDREAMQDEIMTFDAIMRRESRPDASVLPTREQLARLYSMLRACGEWSGSIEMLHHAVNADMDSISVLTLLIALTVWREANLIDLQDMGDKLRVRLLPAVGKADLSATPLWRYVEGEDHRA